ncbi:MAG TPA: SPFH domain-containing protein [Burkholderiaceae bacterium]|jgi:regulator of protease activity HflC (stomatin/prohibitin superfamily)|nr:SPFH domain-containing protein [Burkholderiaceae bacterium]HPE01032.1 SPFH domain-containing protein [Burkholderiaceae bacterium]HRZ01190.1 SPFH domain-containing protein [Burkholderiaceae bacterium]
MSASRTHEIERRSTSGYLMVAIGLALILAGAAMLLRPAGLPGLILDVALILVGVFVLAGLYMLQPNEAAILLLFGQYVGTDRSEGLRWANPFYKKQKISLRAHNFVSDRLKVNDKRGNPIEIAAAIVWRVRNTAQAVFDVEDYQSYVTIQAESAVRHLASSYAYDEGEDPLSGEPTLRGGQDRITEALIAELTERFDQAGIVVEDAKLTHLAYAPEIAQVMLRRQQAEAIIAARAKIVHGAVSMVEMALKGLSERQIVELDDERRAAMVSNLLVVLCSDNDAQPVINTGTLYQG